MKLVSALVGLAAARRCRTFERNSVRDDCPRFGSGLASIGRSTGRLRPATDGAAAGTGRTTATVTITRTTSVVGAGTVAGVGITAPMAWRLGVTAASLASLEPRLGYGWHHWHHWHQW